MGGRLFFRIPDDPEVMVKLVEAVPSSWSWVDGGLHAPEVLIASGEVIADTGFTIQRFHSIHPTVVGQYEHERQGRALGDLFAIIAERKLPGFVSFNEAGYNKGRFDISLELAKRIAVAFIRKGYRGGLNFYSGHYREYKFPNPEKCRIVFEPWRGAPFMDEESGEQPPRVKLEWENERCHGKRENLEPILAVCRYFDLTQYEPVANYARR